MASSSRRAGSPTSSPDAGLEPEIVEPVPGRGSVHARLRGDGTGGEPLLLLSHLDVVPAPAERWTHDPFAADLVDGYIYGRGAVDMKAMVAMELGVVRLLAAEARAAGLDPARDPIPGLRRDVLFTCTADEEAGGLDGRQVGRRASAGMASRGRRRSTNAAAWRRRSRAGGSTRSRSPRRASPPTGSPFEGRGATAPCRARTTPPSWPPSVIDRLAVAGSDAGHAGHGPLPRDSAAAELPPDAARILDGLSGDDPGRAEAAIAVACDPMYARALRALVRDTVSPDVVHCRHQVQRDPGRRHRSRSTVASCRARPSRRCGPSSWRGSDPSWPRPAGSSSSSTAHRSRHRPTGTLFDLLAATIRDHDPDGIPLPVMAPFATDAKHSDALGTPTYGFSPLRLDPDERFLERFHGVDERVSVDALRWGLPVLYDVVRRFCG